MWAELYTLYERHYAKIALPKLYTLASIIKSDLKGQNLLDIGCSKGLLLEASTKLGIKATGIDISLPALKSSSASDIILAGAERLPFRDKVFNIVVAHDVLEHLDYRKLTCAVRDIIRATYYGGFIVVRTPRPGSFSATHDPTHKTVMSFSRWSALFKETGANMVPFYRLMWLAIKYVIIYRLYYVVTTPSKHKFPILLGGVIRFVSFIMRDLFEFLVHHTQDGSYFLLFRISTSEGKNCKVRFFVPSSLCATIDDLAPGNL